MLTHTLGTKEKIMYIADAITSAAFILSELVTVTVPMEEIRYSTFLTASLLPQAHTLRQSAKINISSLWCAYNHSPFGSIRNISADADCPIFVVNIPPLEAN